ncbi:MAG TPA: DUF5916 domain-containing protein [Lacibacter sp.]|nr:DUF5916 domain-containing protein [Lacibacter sp.]HMO87954.1 DUF5916 domain-containing protein [Lacibacter sp.]
MKIYLLFLLCLFFFVICKAQDHLSVGNFPPSQAAPMVRAIEVTEPMLVDGKLSEAVWSRAVAVKDFFRMEPRQGGSYLYETWVKILFDRKNLYFGVFCKDSLGKKGVRVQDLRRDFVYGENDVFYLQLDPQNLKRFCVSFQTTPFGNQRDLQVFDDVFRDNDWDALWRVRTTITDTGYYAEFAIPFVSLRYEKQATDSVSWGITFARLARRDYEQTVFPAVPQAFSPYRMTYAAQLQGLKLPPPAVNLRLQPYTLVQHDKNTNAANDIVSRTNVKAGGEVKWAINPHAVLDVTFNTDFAQADVDRAVNNLTRFNVFFQERRQFFLENSGVYTGANYDGIKPFFSRSIGLANTQFNADPVGIDAGARYTDRTQKRTIAGLYVHQRATENQGAANFGVFRYLKNYGKQNNIGLMVTHRLDEADPSKGFQQRNNTTVSIDGFMRPNDTWQVEYMVSAARDNTNDSIGVASYFYAGWMPQNWYAGWVTKYVSERYVPGMGFVFAINTIHHNPGFYRIIRPKGRFKKLIRRYDPGMFVNYYQNANDLRFQSAQLDIFPVFIIFSDNSLLDMTWHPTWERFFFQPLGFEVKKGDYFFHRFEIRYRSDASKKLSADVKFFGGDYYDGKLDEWSALIRLAPSPKLSVTTEYQLNRIRNLGVNSVTEDISLYTVGIRMAQSPRLQLSTFYQYNSFDRRGRWNVRGSWEFAPLSFFYIVFNENNFRNSPVQNQNTITKLTYLKQF